MLARLLVSLPLLKEEENFLLLYESLIGARIIRNVLQCDIGHL
jgi:hypothetical protein